MAEETGQERTEEATPKRLREAQEKGQVARSRELTTMIVLIASSAGFLMLGNTLLKDLLDVMRNIFHSSRDEIMDIKNVPLFFEQALIDSVIALLPFLFLLGAAALFSPMLLSGWSFSVQALSFKWEKMDPIKGAKKMFSARAIMELVKALAKFSIVMGVLLILLWNNIDDLLALGTRSAIDAISDMGTVLSWSFLMLSGAMVIIAAVDVPFQIWDHARQLKMTRQEIKDEYKETEGSPEMKRRVREVQRQMAERRMMEEVPKADVIVTNPTHYAVALRYDQIRMSAPIVVAKGKDLVAVRIRSIAEKNGVPILTAPPLSRAIYFSTELKQEVPAGLYLAVAQVLAYVFQLRRSSEKQAVNQPDLDDLPIPDDLQHD